MIEYGWSTCRRVVIRPTGENLDAAAVHELEAAIAGRVAAGPVILDLARVRFADSLGLGLLVRLARQGGGKVAVAGIGSALQKCLGRVPAGVRPAAVGYTPAPAPADRLPAAPTQCGLAGPKTRRLLVRTTPQPTA